MTNIPGFIELKPQLYYEIATGEPYSSRGHNLRRLEGTTPYGYKVVWDFDSKKTVYYAHVVWEHFNGPIPQGFKLDHKNSKKDDNRIDNLQLLTHRENVQKRLANKDRLFRGVSKIKKGDVYRAQVLQQYNKKRTVYIVGHYKKYSDAVQAALKARLFLYGFEMLNDVDKKMITNLIKGGQGKQFELRPFTKVA